MSFTAFFNRPLRLLLVEDRPLLHDALLRLWSDDHEINAASTPGSEVIDRAIDFQPHLIVLSVFHPWETTFLSARSIREQLIDIPVVFLEENCSPEHVMAAFKTYPTPLCVFLNEKSLTIEIPRAAEMPRPAWGYCTWQQDAAVLRHTLFNVAAGICTFCPEAAEALQLTSRLGAVAPPAGGNAFRELSKREREICRYLVAGMSVRECADRLGLAASTVDNHKCRLMKKLRVHKAVDLVRMVFQENIRNESHPPRCGSHSEPAFEAASVMGR